MTTATNKATQDFIARPRPRVLIQSADLESLQARREGGFHQRIFDNLVMEADQQLTFPYEYTPRGWHPVGLDAEWRAYVLEHVTSYRTSEDIQVYLPIHAFLFRLTEDKKYLSAARDWLLGVCSWPFWGLRNALERDYEAGWILQAASLAYDWLYSELNADERALVRAAMNRVAGNIYDNVSDQLKDTKFSAHGFSQIPSIGLAGLALLGEDEAAPAWIDTARNLCRDWLNRRFTAQGAAMDKLAYFGWVGADVARFLVALEVLTGEEEWDHPQWRRGVTYALSLYSGRIDSRYCDYTVAWDHHLHSLLFLTAGRLQMPEAQWLPLHEADETVLPHARMRCWEFAPNWDILNYLWYDDTVTAAPPKTGLSQYFEGVGIVAMRSGWTRDDVWLMFKCGASDRHGLHAEPENRFEIKGFGETLSDVIITDYAMVTDNFNTVLVNDCGQSAPQTHDDLKTDADAYIERNTHARIEHYLHCGNYTSVLGNAAAVYPDLLTRYDRHIQMFPDKYFVIHDTLSCPQPATITWPLHCEGEIVAQDQWYHLQSGDAELCVRILSPDDATIDRASTLTLFEKNGAFEVHDDGRDPWRRADGSRAWPLEQRERYPEQPYLKVTVEDTVDTKITALLWPRRISAADDRPLPEVTTVAAGCYRVQRESGAELLWFGAVETPAVSCDAERGSLWLDDAGRPVGGSYVNGRTMRIGDDVLAHTPMGANLAFTFDPDSRRLSVTVNNLSEHLDNVIVSSPGKVGALRLEDSGGKLESHFAHGRLQVLVSPGETKFSALTDCDLNDK
jgi:hypothetical protein